MEEIIKKYPEYHWDEKIIDIGGMEVFIDAPRFQKCGPILIDFGVPNTKIYFKKEEAILALKVAAWKISPGYYTYDVILYVNGKEMEFDAKSYKKYYESFLTLVKERNEIIIFFKNPLNTEYSEHILMHLRDGINDKKYRMEEVERWLKL